MREDPLPDHVQRNRTLWDHDAEDWVVAGERNWAGEPVWGIWAIPETELRLLLGDMGGLRGRASRRPRRLDGRVRSSV